MNQGFFRSISVSKTAAIFICAGVFIFHAGIFTGDAQTENYGGFFSITEENDAYSDFFGTHQDRHYTHGIKLTYLAGDDVLTNVAGALDDFFPKLWIAPTSGEVGVEAGQSIYTPENILATAPIPTDRPYAGWLYAGLIYQRRADPATNFGVLENFEINLGLVGPDSQADYTQELIHRWRFPQDVPRGWPNQIKDEPGIVLKYARLWRWSPTDKTAKFVDVIPRAGFELGNVFTFATGGASLRLGWNLPKDFGEQIIDSPSSPRSGFTAESGRFFGYLFAGVDGRAIGHDITLDGNSFRSGPNIAKYYFVGDFSLGFAVQFRMPWLRQVELAYVHVDRTKEFHGQSGDDVFGSVLMKVSRRF